MRGIEQDPQQFGQIQQNSLYVVCELRQLPQDNALGTIALVDKGKLAERRGRKATGLRTFL